MSTPQKIEFQGIPVVLDRPKGFIQKGEDDQGTPWVRLYKNDYGFLVHTQGGDGEELDVFIGPNKEASTVYWATQVKADNSFDEYKIFLGCSSLEEARAIYIAHIPERFLKGIVPMPMAHLQALCNTNPKVRLGSRLQRRKK